MYFPFPDGKLAHNNHKSESNSLKMVFDPNTAQIW